MSGLTLYMFLFGVISVIALRQWQLALEPEYADANCSRMNFDPAKPNSATEHQSQNSQRNKR